MDNKNDGHERIWPGSLIYLFLLPSLRCAIYEESACITFTSIAILQFHLPHLVAMNNLSSRKIQQFGGAWFRHFWKKKENRSVLVNCFVEASFLHAIEILSLVAVEETHRGGRGRGKNRLRKSLRRRKDARCNETNYQYLTAYVEHSFKHEQRWESYRVF